MEINTILDSIIALVIIILVLSLIVQSVQQALKKLFKIKSRQLEESLVDLFETVLGKAPAPSTGLAVMPMLDIIGIKRLGFKTSIDKADPAVRTLYLAVVDEFRKIGRVAQSGNLMLDSISKDDLLKMIQKVAPAALAPGGALPDAFKAAAGLVSALKDNLDQLAKVPVATLSGSAGPRIAALRDLLTPIINDVEAITTGGTLSSTVVTRDLLALRSASAKEVFALLGQIQDAVHQQRLTASDRAQVIQLDAAAITLQAIAHNIVDLTQGFDAAFAPLRAKLRDTETWFDTVMQSFDERYARGMQTWGLVISFSIVVLLNANLFGVYEQISQSDTVRNQLIQAADSVRKASSAPQPTAAGSTSLQQAVAEVGTKIDLYRGFQFRPLSLSGLTSDGVFKMLFGWLLMTALLSAGAPFWEDVLESLFGVKDLIRGRAAIKNVEQPSGAGNPKS